LGISRQQLRSPKMRRVIGIDWRQAIFDNETAITTVASRSKASLEQMSRWLRGHILPQRDFCHVLALETSGAVFGHRVLKQANRRILAKRLVANFPPSSSGSNNNKAKECYRCDCMLDKDRLSAHEECVLCRDRRHTLQNPHRGASEPNLHQILGSIDTHDNEWHHMDTKQEWTEMDGDEGDSNTDDVDDY